MRKLSILLFIMLAVTIVLVMGNAYRAALAQAQARAGAGFAAIPGTKGGQDIFDMRSIDRARGCMVVVRPDQYVAHVLPLDAYAELAAYFDGFMVQTN